MPVLLRALWKSAALDGRFLILAITDERINPDKSATICR
jgi:hypothetical protein